MITPIFIKAHHVIARVDLVQEYVQRPSSRGPIGGVSECVRRLGEYVHDVLLRGAPVHVQTQQLDVQPGAEEAEKHGFSEITAQHIHHIHHMT